MGEESFCDYCRECNLPPPSKQEIDHAKVVIEKLRKREVPRIMVLIYGCIRGMLMICGISCLVSIKVGDGLVLIIALCSNIVG